MHSLQVSTFATVDFTDGFTQKVICFNQAHHYSKNWVWQLLIQKTRAVMEKEFLTLLS